MTRVVVESLNLEAQGVARPLDESGVPGKVVFIDGALPGEDVEFESYKVKSKFELAKLTHIYKTSPSRIIPQCPSFNECGGCSMQHLDPRAQLAMKQRVLEDNLRYLGRIKPEVLLRPISGPAWEYRYRGRLSIFKIPKGRVLVGFHQKKGSRITDMLSCDILPKQQLIKNFAEINHVDIWLQPEGLDSAYPFAPPTSQLCYRLPEFDIEMPFKPTDFTQVNHQVNRVLVSKAIRLLDPKPEDRVLDLFCGIGNFTLPLARRCAKVFGIEGSDSLTKRAKDNAVHNQLGDRVDFACANLFEVTPLIIQSWGQASKWLIDPPRDGAMALATAMAEIAKSGNQDEIAYLPERIVYVSCNPATLARDVGILTAHAGYRLKAAGVVNMFPHTSHIESIAVFER